ncbi:hypothetical protein THASP1DRAFT_32656 [Thamnocephalis sphaerospora]|uniref:Uncharacterized protein n=1 Tax=Thamnocephalis sphaerospora TaxID=78915 RepID=A0A4P9XII0_9FUNG|nr:hypothetical protein THASP1DRAFT_32656 [Thamnocephalis sphaerospora]|eukprot:RKP05506.1 hypothetical protein THASP1DRAFT_32656 [Thamnocephalis sphaerospora]
MTDCNRESTHLVMVYVTVALNISIAAFSAYIIYMRQRHKWSAARLTGIVASAVKIGRYRLLARPVDTMLMLFTLFLLLRPLHVLLCALDIYSTLAARELSVNMTYWVGYWALLVFSVGVMETVLPVLRGRVQRKGAYNIWVPAATAVRFAILVLALAGPAFVGSFGYMAGHYGDLGRWDKFSHYQRIAWLGWSVNMLLVCFIASYFSIALALLLRERTRRLRDGKSDPVPPPASYDSSDYQIHWSLPHGFRGGTDLEPTSSRNALIEATLRPIRRLQYTMLLNAILLLSGSIFACMWALLDSYLLKRPTFSFIVELLVQAAWWGGFILLILTKVHQTSRERSVMATTHPSGRPVGAGNAHRVDYNNAVEESHLESHTCHEQDGEGNEGDDAHNSYYMSIMDDAFGPAQAGKGPDSIAGLGACSTCATDVVGNVEPQSVLSSSISGGVDAWLTFPHSSPSYTSSPLKTQANLSTDTLLLPAPSLRA